MVVIGSYDVLARYVQETTLGVIPANPVWGWVDSGVQALKPVNSKSRKEIYALDQRRDPRFSLYMERAFDYEIDYYISDIKFLTYGITSVNSSISIEEFWNPQVGGTQQYYRFLGNQCNEVKIIWKVGEPTEVIQSFFHKDIAQNAFPDTAQVAGASYGVEPSAQPFLFSDTFIQISSAGGSLQNINILSAEVSIKNKIDRKSGYTVGADTVNNLPLGRRETDIQITRMFEDSSQVAEWTNTDSSQGTSQPITLKLPLGPNHSITINNLKWDPLKLDKDVKRDILVYTFTAKGYEPAAGGSAITLA
jgi:hypothetical protein